jgi:hypothetical protein
VSIQVAILKVLASHGNGRTTLASLKHDIAVLTASGGDWNSRLKRLAGRVPSIDIFGSGYVLCDRDGWEITADGREFLRALEAITQDNRLTEAQPAALPVPESVERPPGELIVVGHRFKNRVRASAAPAAKFSGVAVREESVSKKK